MSKQRQIGVTFTKKNSDLLIWATEEAERKRRPIAWVGQDAFECLRLFSGSLEQAQKAIDTIKQLQVILAWYTGEVKEVEACRALNVHELTPLFREAIEAGKRLVR